MEGVGSFPQKGEIPIVAETKTFRRQSNQRCRLAGLIVIVALVLSMVVTGAIFTLHFSHSATVDTLKEFSHRVREGDRIVEEKVEISTTKMLEKVHAPSAPETNQRAMTLLHDYNLKKTAIRFADDDACYIRDMKPQATSVILEEVKDRLENTKGKPQMVSAVYNEYFVALDVPVVDDNLSEAVMEFCGNRRIQLLSRIPKENSTVEEDQEDVVKSRERRQLLGFPPRGLPHPPPPHGPFPPFGVRNPYGPPRPVHPFQRGLPMPNPYRPPVPGVFPGMPGFVVPPPGIPYGHRLPAGPVGSAKPGKEDKKDGKGILPKKPKKNKGGKEKKDPYVPLDPGHIVGIGPVDPYVPLPPKDPELKPGKKGNKKNKDKKNKKNKNNKKNGNKKCFKQKACKLKEGCEVKTEKYCAQYDLGHRGPWGFFFGIPRQIGNPTCIKWDFREVKDCVNVKECEKLCT